MGKMQITHLTIDKINHNISPNEQFVAKTSKG